MRRSTNDDYCCTADNEHFSATDDGASRSHVHDVHRRRRLLWPARQRSVVSLLRSQLWRLSRRLHSSQQLLLVAVSLRSDRVVRWRAHDDAHDDVRNDKDVDCNDANHDNVVVDICNDLAHDDKRDGNNIDADFDVVWHVVDADDADDVVAAACLRCRRARLSLRGQRCCDVFAWRTMSRRSLRRAELRGRQRRVSVHDGQRRLRMSC